jgi:ATP-dependent DNA helicase RecG
MIALSAPLVEIHDIGPRFITKLKKLGIETVKDLLWHFPTRYEDFSQIYKIADLAPGQEATIQGVVKEIGGRRTWRRRLYLVETLISDESGSIRAVWFNQPYIKNILRPGRTANFSGKITITEDELYLSNPTYELLSEHSHHETKHTGRIVPVYPETKGLTSRGIRYLIKPILDTLQQLPEIIPQEILEKENLPLINKALRDVHFPKDIDDAVRAKKRFAFEDLFLLQLHNLLERLKLAQEKSVAIKIDIEEIKTLINRLPFKLTQSQKQSLWEILKDLEKNHPMNRLFQGDVGSGKTIIAAIAAVRTAHDGYQAAFMAPTEILARQHYNTLIKFFPNFEKGIVLLTSSESKIFYGHGLETDMKKTELKHIIAEGKINPVRNHVRAGAPEGPLGRTISNGVKIVIGTHALIQKNVRFGELALVIVDEQHRFGVDQRANLLKDKKIVPHFLSMSATPIPRTLSLTLFGDLDLSLITELPKNRKPIITKVAAPGNREKAYAFIRGQIKKGRQAFVICPRIEIANTNNHELPMNVTNIREISGKLAQIREARAVKEEYEKLSKKIFPDLRVAMLHGKMKPKEKEHVMKEFAERKSDILVATSVVEVGVDIPNATIMMIEGAERFGLAQLYQFRGRVGRGEHQSFCFLFTDSSAKTTRRRLKSIVEAKNGFELAEKDLQIRGPGEFLGEAQTGIPDLAMKALQNPELVKTARQTAYELLKKDRFLKNCPLLRERLNQFKKDIHLE